MPRAPIALTLLLVVLFSVSTAQASASVEVTGREEVADRVVELTIETPAFAAPTKVHVILPADYDSQPSRRWPVTYFTAGTQNRYSAFADALGGTGLADDFPSIIVSPDANSGYWSDWFNSGSFGPPKYETFVIDQLIPLIDQRFRTIAKRSHRAIFGISMGGYGAMMLAARHPDLFSAAATLSGAVDSNIELNGAVLSFSSTFDGAPFDAIYGPRESEEVRWRGHNPWDLAGNLRGLDLQIRSANGVLNPDIGEGSEDPTTDRLSCAVEEGTWNASISLHERMKALKVPHAWTDYGPGCHSLQNFQREVTDTLARFRKVFAKPPSAPKILDYRSVEPAFGVWGWQVSADRRRALEFLRIRTDAKGVTLTGSGVTRVTTPPRFRGVKKVFVNGRTTRPGRDGRLTFTVNLGPAHTVQQYRPGGATRFETKRVSILRSRGR
jgi:S-formylglutathione hydrolase FrmB